MSALLVFSLTCILAVPHASAQTMHSPTTMPTARAEAVGMSTDGLSRIDEAMQNHIDAGHIQGAVTIVARRGKVVHFSTHGEMDVSKSRAMESDAIFRMASSTKPVLGAAAMMMIEEGLIQPSDPVSKYIPEFADLKIAVLATPEDRNISPAWVNLKNVPDHRLVPLDTPLTIHHLLTHTSGIMSGGLGAAVNPSVKHTKGETLASYVPQLAKVPLDFQPGTRWSYSPRTGLDVVARIIEIVSRTPFDEFLRKRIFDPLQMNNSYFNLPFDKESKRVVIRGKSDWAKLKGWGGPTKYFSASGGLSSAAEDYLHFEQMLLSGGELFGHRLLRAESVEMMSRNQVGELFIGGRKGRNGMGFGYTVAVTLDPDAAKNNRGTGAFGWGGAFGTTSWTDPRNQLVAVIMLQQPHGPTQNDFGKAVRQSIIE
ncbi:MAG: beta-lactamase family protein [Fuerstiella sp.]|nr:beta-lactamase family protein [Fuerstiella sp.]